MTAFYQLWHLLPAMRTQTHKQTENADVLRRSCRLLQNPMCLQHGFPGFIPDKIH